ncbi:hypothetical protein BOTBODRAFT_430804 [Botryobasidium botryosum FD-172 SS1]|uniref:Uncharacterized protein n=1 Tax=Botryobasidium botryosum (strain FD-172 SS1) TaxID=930990 RepID=A0A067M7X6_BOTB1|nr:hypothetical protein BOTBODRAFT_430804 [Botryobasidium botryosum FD-172 SS1]
MKSRVLGYELVSLRATTNHNQTKYACELRYAHCPKRALILLIVFFFRIRTSTAVFALWLCRKLKQQRTTGTTRQAPCNVRTMSGALPWL